MDEGLKKVKQTKLTWMAEEKKEAWTEAWKRWADEAVNNEGEGTQAAGQPWKKRTIQQIRNANVLCSIENAVSAL